MLIPTISLNIRENTAETHAQISDLRDACLHTGFFYLENHDIPSDLILKVFEQSKKLFTSLTLPEKKQLSDSVLSRGYTAFEEEVLDPSKQKLSGRGDTKEGYYIASDKKEYNPSKLHGPNIYPTPETCESWTEKECEEFRDVMDTYFKEASRVGFEVVRLLALAIGVKEDYFDNYFTDPMAALRCLHYSSEPSDPTKGLFACGAHSDYGMITLLLTDENPGLEIYHQGKWEKIMPPSRSSGEIKFIVNLGDMLERWTNGNFKSTLHRVVTPSNQDEKIERYSIPFFYEPNFDAIVECIECCLYETLLEEEGENKVRQKMERKYDPIKSGDFLLQKYKETHTDFTPTD